MQEYICIPSLDVLMVEQVKGMKVGCQSLKTQEQNLTLNSKMKRVLEENNSAFCH